MQKLSFRLHSKTVPQSDIEENENIRVLTACAFTLLCFQPSPCKRAFWGFSQANSYSLLLTSQFRSSLMFMRYGKFTYVALGLAPVP